MKAVSPLTLRWRPIVPALALTLGVTLATFAFPPAPPHRVFGLVRDEQGDPLRNTGAEVLLDAGGATLARATISTGIEPGVNYRLAVALDAGATADLYRPSAVRPTVPFRLRVRIGNVTYLPIEMSGAANLLTRPGESSRVDLTLGVDSDGDGLPDAWELALNTATGGQRSLADIRPEDDADADGLTNLQEYLAGTYAFDPADGFALAIRMLADGQALLDFTAIRGRSYAVHGSSDMQHWSPVAFRLSTERAGLPPREIYSAHEVRPVSVSVAEPDSGEPVPRFFKLVVH